MQDSYHKLHSLEYVSGLFSNGQKVSPRLIKDVERAARQAGTYIALGDNLWFHNSDITALFASLRPRGTGKPEPLDTDDVMLVVIGHRLDPSADMFVGWAWSGRVDELYESVALGAPGVHVLEFRPCAYGEYKLHVASIEAERSIGRWYHRTPAFNAWLLATFATGDNENG